MWHQLTSVAHSNGLTWAWINAYEHVRDRRNAWKALVTYASPQ